VVLTVFCFFGLFFYLSLVVYVHRTRSAPISRCTSASCAMKMTLDHSGWWMMRNSSSVDIFHEVVHGSMTQHLHLRHHPTIHLHSKPYMDPFSNIKIQLGLIIIIRPFIHISTKDNSLCISETLMKDVSNKWI